MRVWMMPLLAGCLFGGPKDRCEEQADCEGLDEAAVQACQDGLEVAADSAADAGCLPEHDDLQACTSRSGECDESGEVAVYRLDADDCAEEQQAFSECVGG